MNIHGCTPSLTRAAKGAEIALYTLGIVAIALGILGAQGILGHQLQNFMTATLPKAVPIESWFALGAAPFLLPQLIRMGAKVGERLGCLQNRSGDKPSDHVIETKTFREQQDEN